MSVIGHVHSVETCGTVDGPGIRFIIFLQGCLMRCKYCHNRDTWDLEGGKDMTVDELMAELLQYRHFMNASGGGITISGGEAMLQPEFVKAMFEACRLEGIHTCLDTNGFVRRIDDTTKAVLDVADLVLLDIKQMDNKKHIDLTHVSNKYTLDFAKYLAEQNQPVYLRYVVVPGYTDCVEDAHTLGKFIQPMKNIEKIEMLPYHELGKHKWTAMGEIYPLDGVSPPARETMEEIKNILLQYNDNVIY
ncbi:pyruvate formate lyase-activating protein [Psychromonas sp. psych-6C06]|uniref:pyruvate formate lyase 1-activating protein n=1 Tax=Psychromonas sp. psych-6C06 TaxID=2058089 RepID=UPI000C336EB3|nr:pyruvate formate lyase 1-activating protein [Psychromonas sp. psych-6C06]PKF61809.1 pyruvate formate lyase-activating protein [Psychromonas sp. psych-6C06]